MSSETRVKEMVPREEEERERERERETLSRT
jgi:hypothetical protein